jgi:chromosome partitioning protein
VGVTAGPQRRATILTVLNLKGGVGKTHTGWLLASVGQERGRRILLIDTDTQANLTSSFLPPDQTVPGVEQLFHSGEDADIGRIIRPTAFAGIDIIPSSPALARFDLSEQLAWERADLHLSLVDPLGQLRAEYDYIVIDCPPRLSLVSFAALCASDGVIVPLEAADWGALGIRQVTDAVDYVQRHFNGGLTLLGYVVSRFKQSRTYQQSYLAQLRRHFGPLAFDTVLPDLAKFEQSVTDRVPITRHSPRSAAAGVARAFFDEVERRVQGLARSRRRIRNAAIVAA